MHFCNCTRQTNGWTAPANLPASVSSRDSNVMYQAIVAYWLRLSQDSTKKYVGTLYRLYAMYIKYRGFTSYGPLKHLVHHWLCALVCQFQTRVGSGKMEPCSAAGGQARLALWWLWPRTWVVWWFHDISWPLPQDRLRQIEPGPCEGFFQK